MLRIENLSLRSGRRELLHGIDLAIHPGAITAILGPSGAGKSTLLRAIAGDLRHSGRITLNGRDVAHSPASEMARIRAVLPQASALAFPLRCSRWCGWDCRPPTSGCRS